jgi:hypothetical protein
MFRGFLWGSLALIMLYVAVQEGTSRKTALASNALLQGAQRLFSPEVAGIGDHSKTTPTGPSEGSRVGARAEQSTGLAESQPQGTLFTS